MTVSVKPCRGLITMVVLFRDMLYGNEMTPFVYNIPYFAQHNVDIGVARSAAFTGSTILRLSPNPSLALWSAPLV